MLWDVQFFLFLNIVVFSILFLPSLLFVSSTHTLWWGHADYEYSSCKKYDDNDNKLIVDQNSIFLK